MRPRVAVAALALSASALVGIALNEGYTEHAVIPTRGDVPTVGFGSTRRDDGSPVQMGDMIKPPQALARSLAHIEHDEAGIKHCVTAPLYQAEYDLLVDFAYQYGVPKLCASTMVREANAGRYVESCKGYLKYRFSQGRDCSLPKHWGPGGCKGVWLRNRARYERCKGEANA